MRRFLKSRVIEWMLASWIIYWPFAFFVPVTTIFTIINGVLMAMWIGLLVAFWRATWIAVRGSTQRMGSSLVLVGIAGLALSITAIFTWGWFYQYEGQPSWMLNNVFRGWISWIFLCSTGSLVVASMTDDQNVFPKDSWRRVGFIVALAVMLTLGIVYTIGGFARQ